MNYGLIALILLQLAFVGGSIALFVLQKSQADMQKHESLSWGIEVKAAVSTADSAKRAVEMIEVTHFNKLRALYEAQGLDLVECRKEIASLRSEVMQLRTKNASAARSEQREAKRNSEGTAPGNSSEEGVEAVPGLSEAIKNGSAYALPQPVPPVVPPRRPFGWVP